MTRFFRYIAFALASMMVVPAYAEETDYEDDFEDEAHFGIRAQLDFNRSVSVTDIVKWGPGTSVGIAYYAPFGRLTYFNAGLLFSYTTMRLNGQGGNKYSHYDIVGHIKMPSLRLPLDFGVKFIDNRHMRCSVYTGPHFYFNFDVKGDYDLIRTQSTTKVNEKITNSGMEIGWGLGVAVDLSRHWHAHFEGTVGLSHFGTTNEFTPGTPSALRRGELSLGLGYNF